MNLLDLNIQKFANDEISLENFEKFMTSYETVQNHLKSVKSDNDQLANIADELKNSWEGKDEESAEAYTKNVVSVINGYVESINKELLSLNKVIHMMKQTSENQI